MDRGKGACPDSEVLVGTPWGVSGLRLHSSVVVSGAYNEGEL